MTLAGSARRILHRSRAVMGRLGFRPYAVTLVQSIWVDEETLADTSTVIAHSGGQPPKVRFLTLKERHAAGIRQLAIEVGPITPEHSGGGYSAATLRPELGTDETWHYLVTGPGMADGGSKFALAELRVDKALSYRLILELSENGLDAAPAEIGF